MQYIGKPGFKLRFDLEDEKRCRKFIDCACVVKNYYLKLLFHPFLIQSMVFITILLFTVTYIFAIAGVIFFESYTRSNRQDLVFHQSFRYS